MNENFQEILSRQSEKIYFRETLIYRNSEILLKLSDQLPEKIFKGFSIYCVGKVSPVHKNLSF